MSKSVQNRQSLIDDPAYIRCAMVAFEEGAKAAQIKQRCQCEAEAGALDQYVTSSPA